MILSSTPETNDDPYPWAFSQACSITSQEVWHNNRFAERRDSALLWFPRPEYNRAHEPNPVLVAYREYGKKHRMDTYAEYWKFAFAAYNAFGGWNDWDAPEHNFHSLTLATDEEIDHADKVLTRWLAVFKR